MQFKAVIFDLDGTLIDSLEDLKDAVNYVLSNHNFKTRDSEFVRMAVGNGMRNLIRDTLPEKYNTDNDMIDLCTKELKEYYLSHWNIKTHLYDGVKELLDYLKENNILTCVLSNKADKPAKVIVNHFFKGFHFSAVSGEIPGIPIKPDPTLALKIADDLGLKPCEVLFLGDSAQDIETAKNAKMFAAGALWGFRDEKTLKDAGADTVFAKPIDLISFIKNYI